MRRATKDDREFVFRALEANGDLEQMSFETLWQMLAQGRIEFYIYETPESVLGVGVLRGEGTAATLVAFHREGPKWGLLAEARYSLHAVSQRLVQDGITEIVADVHRSNPKYQKLLRFYERLGFTPMATRLRMV